MSELPEVRLEAWPPGHVSEGPPYNLDVKVGNEWFALAVMGTTHFGGPHSEERRAVYIQAVEQVTRLLLAAPALLAALKVCIEKMADYAPIMWADEIAQAREAVREADLDVQKSTPDETSS
jgi:hypothetical protein